MQKTTLSLVCAAICAFTPFLRAQDGMAPPVPAPELNKLQPLIGNWSGSGVFHEPQAGAIPWQAVGTYQWSHDKFWVREDFTITFEGNPNPLAFRAYLGWDGENKRYVNVSASNGGEVGVHEMQIQPDGSFVQLMMQNQNGQNYAERSVFKVDGKRMTHKMDMLMADGASMLVVDGKFEKSDAASPNALKSGVFMMPPADEMAPFQRAVGVYEVKGSMIMAPGAPAMKITGRDTFATVLGGTVLHGHTDGAAEGMPGKYESDAFWGWDKKKNCFITVYVSNMGEVGSMEARFSADGKSLISTGMATMQGAPMVQRFVLELDDKGAWKRGIGHSLFGSEAPFEGFNATYQKK